MYVYDDPKYSQNQTVLDNSDNLSIKSPTPPDSSVSSGSLDSSKPQGLLNATTPEPKPSSISNPIVSPVIKSNNSQSSSSGSPSNSITSTQPSTIEETNEDSSAFSEDKDGTPNIEE